MDIGTSSAAPKPSTKASPPPNCSARERALRHYDRAIEALTGGAYTGLDVKERETLLATLSRYRSRLLTDAE